ncbi:hypothetical protein J1N35_029236 [Gossypium stocksii]|uniref:Uncharacterized protein n=1 Tax=Gossypium stocksii TaxID=47602 RepID=A0A9D3UZN1_9ROSI|nr:hypothetical protein J1N35_029236 [Gossypium stocksii]
MLEGSPGIWIPQGHYKAALICGHLARTKAIATLCCKRLTAKYHASKLVVIDLSRVLKAWILAEREYLLG